MDKTEIIRKILGEDPKNASAWYLLGVEYLEQGMPSEALQAFSEALKHCDDELRQKVFTELAKLSGTPTSANSAVERHAHNTDNAGNGNSSDDAGRSGQAGNLVNLRVIQGGKKGQKTDLADKTLTTITFDDVGGLEDLKETIRMRIVRPFTTPGLFERFKKKIGGGILLFGPPGCGKTFIARATAGECHARFIAVHITDILDPYLGTSEQNIKDIFSTARASKPSILFFDEIDALGYNRAKLSSDLMRPIIDQLLAEIEGIDSSTDKLLIIGATNMPWDVDPAFKRPGRFDKMLFVPPPDEVAREAIFKLKLADKPAEAMDFKLLAAKTELYSGADIENVVELATENVIAEILKTGVERPVRMKDLVEAVEAAKPSTIEWLRTIKNYVKYANQSGLYDEVEKFLARHRKI